MATLPGLESIPLQPPRGETPIATYQPGMVQEAQEQQGQAVAKFGADVTQGGGEIADAQDRITYAAAEQQFLSAKLNADQSALSDPDYANAPQKYLTSVNQSLATAAQNIRSPTLRAEFVAGQSRMINFGADAVFRQSQAKSQQADRSYLDNYVTGIGQQYAQATDDATRSALLVNGGSMIDAMAQKGSITAEEQTTLKRNLSQNAPVSRADALVRTAPDQALKILAPSGQTETGDPVYSPTGTWVDHIPPAQRSELYQQAQRDVQANQNAAEVQAERQQRLQDKADTDAGEQAADGYIKQLTIDPTKVDPIAIANDPHIPASQWRTRMALISMAQQANGQDADTATKTYGPGFYDLYRRTMLPAGDPNRITDPTDLFSQVGPGKPLTIAGLDKLRTEMAGRGTPEGASAAKFQALALDRAKRELMWDEDLGGGYRVPDPHGADAFDHFQAQFFSYWDNGIKAGQTPAQLADLDTIDKMVAPLKRTPAQWVQDRLNADDSTLPPQAGNAAPKDPQIDLVPPAMNTRVAGTTTVLTPKGKFLWEGDGWHPIQ